MTVIFQSIEIYKDNPYIFKIHKNDIFGVYIK